MKSLTLLDGRMISTGDFSGFRISECQEDCVLLVALIYIPVRIIEEPGVPFVDRLFKVTPVCNDFNRFL